MFKYIKAFFKGGYRILFAYPKINRYAKHKDKYSLEERYNYIRKLINIVFKSLGVTINVEGLDKLDNLKNYLFVSNHQSFMDALAMIYVFDNPTIFVAKKESKDYPIAGKVIDAIDAIFFDRENIRDAVRMIKACKENLSDGRSVVIYPEGTRTKDENYIPGEYKAGALKSAYETKKDIVVVVIDGSYKALSRKYKKDIAININFLEVINYDEYNVINTNDLTSQIQSKTNIKLFELRKQ